MIGGKNMKEKNLPYVMGKPMCYYSVSLYFGCCTYICLNYNKILGAAIAASFLLTMFFTLERKFLIITMGFFILGTISIYMYFNLNLPNCDMINVRVIEDKGFIKVAKYKNKKLFLRGIQKKIEEGKIIEVKGRFINKVDFSKGVVGEYTVEKINSAYVDTMYNFFALKRKIFKSFVEGLGEEKAAVIMALCYGESEYLSTSQRDNFQKLGVVHAACVSGFHMAVIYKILESLLGLKFAGIISVVYIIFTGSKASTVRAFVMIIILKLSSKLFRNYDGISSLSTAALILLLMRPYYVLDIGFNLSFLAVLGILLYSKRLQKFFYKLPIKINESLSLSISSQIFSMPYAAVTFNKFSVGFVIGNIVLLPVFSFVIILGNLALVFYKFNHIFKIICYMLKSVLTISQGAIFLLLKITPSLIYFSYIDIIAYIMFLTTFILVKKGKKKLMYFPICILIIVMMENYKVFPEISYLNLGREDVVLLRYKNQSVILSNKKVPKDKIKFPLKNSRDIDRVEETTIKLCNGFVIETWWSKDKHLDLFINDGYEKKILTSRGKSYFEKIDNFRYYDIIEVPIEKRYDNFGEILVRYIFIGGNTFKIVY